MHNTYADFSPESKKLFESTDSPLFIFCKFRQISQELLLEKIKHFLKSRRSPNFHINVVFSKGENLYFLEEFLKNNLKKSKTFSRLKIVDLDDFLENFEVEKDNKCIFYDCSYDLLSSKRILKANEIFSRSFDLLLFLDNAVVSQEYMEKFSFYRSPKTLDLMFEGEESNEYKKEISQDELNEFINPSPRLNKNDRLSITKKEWITMVIESRAFTFLASLLTFGLYYLYYLFCLEQERDNPFVPVHTSKDKYSFDKPYSSTSSFIEAQNINRKLSQLASSNNEKAWKSSVIEAFNGSWFQMLGMHLSIIKCNIVNWFERCILWIFKQDLQTEDKRMNFLNKNIRDWKKFDRGIKEYLKGKVKSFYGVYDEEMDLINALSSGLFGKKTSRKKDYYLTFVFYTTYIFISLITMGLFPVYHLLFKNRWNDFRNIRQHREYFHQMEFNKVTDKLMGEEGNVEYSYLLLGRSPLPLNLNFFSDAFRTKMFCSRSIRKKIVTFLMIITLGLFGVAIISKNVFDKPDLNISIEDSQMTDYSKIKRKIDRFKFFIMDLIRDLGVANKIAARRISTINKSINSLLDNNNGKDFWIAKFMGLLSSELYFWLFSFIIILSSVTGLFAWIYMYPYNFYYSWSFWVVFSGSVIFLVLFTRHIRLLFT